MRLLATRVKMSVRARCVTRVAIGACVLIVGARAASLRPPLRPHPAESQRREAQAINTPPAPSYNTSPSSTPGKESPRSPRSSRAFSPLSPRFERGLTRIAAAPNPVLGGVCTDHTECDDCDPCTQDLCVANACTHGALSDGTSCGDAIFCDGEETCQTGVCTAGTAIDCGDGACDEFNDICVSSCRFDAACDDGVVCNGSETCDAKTCVGGDDAGDACLSSAECRSGSCVGGGTGLCVGGAEPCGPGGGCAEPVDMMSPTTCGLGRCCDAGGVCMRTTFDSCDMTGGKWLATGNDTSACSGDPCPIYSSGIAPLGTFVVQAGPVSNDPCDGLSRLGDDYSSTTTTGFINLTTFRWVGGVENAGDTIAVEWFDENGVLVGDEFFTIAFAGSGVHTVDLPVPLTIPDTGFVALSAKSVLSPGTKIHWNTTDAVDVGVNDSATIWVDTGPTMPTILGGAPGVLAFELIGDETFSQLGACCDISTGACTHELPWICRDSGFTHRGVGTVCRSCFNDILAVCDTDVDCPACIGGSNDGDACALDVDCLGGGTCSASSTCIDAPPNCAGTACCDPATGSCIEVSGRTCTDAVTPCFSDADCGAGECIPDCPAGTISQGLGTSCGPNCCSQPIVTAGDTCDTATVLAINVPLPGDPPISYTITGDNSTATFGDYIADGTGTCQDEIHSPTGVAQDRGWFEVFQLNACADVRIDLCCTEAVSGLPNEPLWSFLRTDCNPCTTIVEPEVVAAPLGADTVAVGYGAPFCVGSDVWFTYRSLPPGAYFQNIFSGLGATPGPYQMHVTASACPQAACCLPEMFCVDVNETIVDGGGGPIPCTTGAGCGAGQTCAQCAIADEVDCSAVGGFFNGFGSLPTGADPIVTCFGGACDIGSCCTGPGDCEDRAVVPTPCDIGIPGTCMTQAICDSVGGSFSGGERCDFPSPPCPACTVIDAATCQAPDGDFLFQADRTNGGGLKVADDFEATNTQIQQLCWWACFLDPEEECADPDTVPGPPTDNWTVRFYDDAGDIPGTLLHEVTSTPISAKQWLGEGSRCWQYSTDLDPDLDGPLTGFNIGQRYWVEISGEGAPGGCATYILSSTEGNGLSYWEFDDLGWAPTDVNAHNQDIAMCLDGGTKVGSTATGACCLPDGICTDGVSANACAASGGLWSVGELCASVGCVAFGTAPDDCASERLTINEGTTEFNNASATTDGPSPVSCNGTVAVFENDVWFDYTATCDGTLTVSLCDGTTYDAIVSVYGDESTTCGCPSDNGSQLACDDDGCLSGSSPVSGAGTPLPCNDLNCGAGAPSTCLSVTKGNCYTVRVGGVDGVRGLGQITLGCAGSVVYVKGDAVGANDGTSWTDAFTNLQTALANASVAASCPTAAISVQVWVAAGIYTPAGGGTNREASFALANGVTLYGGFAGIETALSERDPVTNITVLSGDLLGNDAGSVLTSLTDENSCHVVTTSATDATAILDGFVVSGGSAALTCADKRGGGILNIGGSATIVGCRVQGNGADFGSGIANIGGDLTIVGTEINGNLAVDSGAAIYNASGSPTITNSTITGNFAFSTSGGLFNASGSPTIISSILWGNRDQTYAGPGDSRVENGQGAQLFVADPLDGPSVRYCCVERFTGIPGSVGNICSGVADPLFVDASGFDTVVGTPDDNLRLMAGSVCIDAGDSVGLPRDASDADGDGDLAESLPLDLGRIPRILNDGLVVDSGRGSPLSVDIGAYEFDADCNGNSTADRLDISTFASLDCNGNGAPDECEIMVGTMAPGEPFFCLSDCDPDCDNDGVPDVCAIQDCNQNDVPDSCELADCAGDPDCDDCNGNGTLDVCDIRFGPDTPALSDCNLNRRPDFCDINVAPIVSQDVDMNGEPDECVNFVGGGMTNAWSVDANWDSNASPTTTGSVTLPGTLGSVDVDVMVQIDDLTLEPNALVNLTDSTGGSLVVADTIEMSGVIAITNTSMSAADLTLRGGAVSIAMGTTTQVDVTGALTLESGSTLGGNSPVLPIAATISAGSVEMLPTLCGMDSQLALTDLMNFSVTSADFVMNGTDTAPCLFAAGRTAALGGNTPPIFVVRSFSFLSSAATSRNSRGAVAGIVEPEVVTPVTITGNFKILASGEVCVGCDRSVTTSPVPAVEVGGDFDNRSQYASLFDWSRGGLQFAAPGPHSFEVAGLDLGQTTAGFLTSEPTTLESNIAHTNFSVGLVELGAGSQVTFQNQHVSTGGVGACGEALYVDTLIIRTGAQLTLDNCRVYYNSLILDPGVSLSSATLLVGCGQLLSTVQAACFQSSPVQLEQIDNSVGSQVISAKNRVLSFATTDVGRTQAIRVTFVALPPPYDIWNGTQLWLGAPTLISENSGNVTPIPGFADLLAATLTCDPSGGGFQEWSSMGTIHVYHEGIVPGGTYAIQTIDQGCSALSEASFSDATSIVNAVWGDASGVFSAGTGSWTAPDNSVDIGSDVVAVLQKFANIATAPIKTRADIEPRDVDFLINISDITRVLDAFSGKPYPFVPSVPTLCP